MTRSSGKGGRSLGPMVGNHRERFEGSKEAPGPREELSKEEVKPTLGLDPEMVQDR